MSTHLRLELTEEEEIEEWEIVKRSLGAKSNTDALRVLIKRAAIEEQKSVIFPKKQEVST